MDDAGPAILFGVAILALGVLLGAVMATGSVRQECLNFGKTTINGAVYICTRDKALPQP